MSWILSKLLGIRLVQQDGTPLPQRRTIDFIGGIAEDDPSNERTKVTVGAGAIANVTGTTPIVVTGTTTKNVAIGLATSGGDGAMSAEDKAKLDEYPAAADMATKVYVDDAIAGISVGGVAGVTAVSGSPVTVDNSDPANPQVGINAASGGGAGSMSSGDYTKLAGIASGAQVCSWSNIVTAGATAASDLAINGRSLTSCVAVTSAGALALTAASGAVTVDASTAVNVATTTATSFNVGHDTIPTTITGLVDCLYDGVAATPTAGRKLRNTTASTVGVTVQYAPSDILEGHARVSGADKTFQTRWTLKPRTNGNTDLVLEYSSDAGATWGTFHVFTTSTSGQFSFASQSYAFASTGGGYFHDASGSGLFFGGAGAGQIQLKSYDPVNPLYLYSEAGFYCQVNGGDDGIQGDAARSLLTISWVETRGIVFTSPPQVISHSVGGSLDLDLSNGQNLEVALAANVTSLTASNAKDGTRVAIVFTQDATGGRTVNFSGSFEATAALGAALDTTANKKTSYWLIVGDNGKLRPLSAPYAWAS